MIDEIAAETGPGCPACGRAGVTASTHGSAEGTVGYARCGCGRWLVVLAGRVIGFTMG
ncbi:hypothetical protein [Streptosporangium pseudovulgare]|uniref:IS1 family transposase n=1 Tax=Streptosporangium pseudovulgare TaxID=35765 RepID=A0ABQ2QWG9_9ACTN|nr:hypothetical protein [Streptosporangium pseudovulgare]GGP97736.1 hypothetical protein GCM10010140_29780 [Streptosporangium pseudovulgare]